MTMPRLSAPLRRLSTPISSPASWSVNPLHFIRHASSRSGSSSQWLQRQRSDPFVRARASGDADSSSDSTTSFVSRSAFKLVELQQKSRGTLIRPGMCIVDLGAAPGGWVQAAAKELGAGRGKGKKGEGVIVGVDLLPLNPEVAAMDGVSFVQGDFLDPIVQAQVVASLAESRRGSSKGAARVDLVLSDMLANLSGNSFRDAQLSIDLCESALAFALDQLAPSRPPSRNDKTLKKPGPSLVMKCLQSSLSPSFQDLLKEHFEGVSWSKPASSRPESREGYWVCSGLRRGKEQGAGQDSWEGQREGDGIYF